MRFLRSAQLSSGWDVRAVREVVAQLATRWISYGRWRADGLDYTGSAAGSSWVWDSGGSCSSCAIREVEAMHQPVKHWFRTGPAMRLTHPLPATLLEVESQANAICRQQTMRRVECAAAAAPRPNSHSPRDSNKKCNFQLQLNSFQKMACPDACGPRTRTRSCWSWRRNSISINIYAAQEELKLQPAWI